MDAPPRRPGVPLPTVRRTITRAAIDAYRAVSGDHNPLHYDDRFAAATRFGGVIAHGMLTLSLASELMAAAYGADWLSAGSLRARFRGAAYPGDALEAVGAVSQCETDANGTVVTCRIAVRKADNGERIITASARVRVSPEAGAATVVQQQKGHPIDE